MPDIVPAQTNLPDTIEDLSLFVLVGREKLISVRAEIRAINKVQFAAEVRDQKRDEARMLSEALLDAEVRLGELMKQIPKQPRIENIRSSTAATSGARTDLQPTDSTVQKLEKPKHEVIENFGQVAFEMRAV